MLHSKSVEARLEQAYRDMYTEDLERLLDLYTDDAIIQSAGAPAIVGRAAIRAFWCETFKQHRVELTPRVEEVTSFGDLVVIRGRATGTFHSKQGGASAQIDVWFMQLYRPGPDGRLYFWRGTNGPNPSPTPTPQS